MFEGLFSKSGLSLERLHSLLKVSESGSLIEAAGHDLGKQSRLSHQLRELSEYFGVELTEKSGRSIRLTAAGRSLAQLAREHFLALQSFRARAASEIPSFEIAAGDSPAQWLLVPAISRLRRPGQPLGFRLSNLRTKDIVARLKERRVDFGLLRADAIESPLEHVEICEQRYAIFVPRRLVPARGLLTFKQALLETPHAALGGEGQMQERMQQVASNAGGRFAPELFCDTVGQCIAAVQTGSYASVLPVQAWRAPSDHDVTVVEDPALEALNRKIALAWHPRTLETKGAGASRARDALANALREEGASAAPEAGED